MALPSPNSSTNKVRKASSGSRPVVTSLSTAKNAGATSVSLLDATGWNTDTAVDVVIYRKDTNNQPVAGTQTDWVATLSGTTLSNMVLRAGTEPVAGYAADSLTVVKLAPTAAFADDLAEAWYDEHKEHGGHGDITADSLTVSGTVSLPAGSIETADVATGAITAEKLSTSAITLGYAEETTTQSKGPVTEADLTGLTTTVTVPAGGRKVRITVNLPVNESSATQVSQLRIYDGTTILTQSNFKSTSTDQFFMIAQAIHTPSAGSHTYKATITHSVSGTVDYKGAATYPKFIHVELV